MNFTKQNNPVVIGILVVILAGSLVIVFRQIKQVQQAMAADKSAHTAAQSTEASPAPASTPSAPTQSVDGFVRPAVTHDPFQQPIDRSALPPPAKIAGPMPALPPHSSMPTATIEPMPVAIPASTTSKAPADDASATPKLDLKSLRVSAVMSGARTVAIVERDGAQPITVGRGDKIGDYDVAKVDDGGIVLSGPDGIVTIPVGSTPDDASTQSEPTSAGMPSSNGDTGSRPQETGNVAQ